MILYLSPTWLPLVCQYDVRVGGPHDSIPVSDLLSSTQWKVWGARICTCCIALQFLYFCFFDILDESVLYKQA